MSYAPTQEQRWDRARDLAKHEPRPTDPIPHRLDKPIAGALEIAMIVKGLVSYAEAAALIEQYAQTKAAEARLQATVEVSDRILAQFEVPNV